MKRNDKKVKINIYKKIRRNKYKIIKIVKYNIPSDTILLFHKKNSFYTSNKVIMLS
jgi:hypothetical protein